ncbi:hypothetical protein OG206_00665 [Streptomyces sp. NBC_01341]|uniref:hypothetical protein n=1 Tax=Streptomyces sp. NBC_01341 TaxID=2903831 RepID=UPI002E12ADBC|nr:hypothetical protein OG206_00665 [Streptomyces sp. NBC_01341]
MTGGALHTQREHAAYLLGRRAHYIVIVKAQPEAPAQTTQIAAWEDIPLQGSTRDRGHGRHEIGRIKAVP